MQPKKLFRKQTMGLLGVLGLLSLNATWNFEANQKIEVQELASRIPMCSGLTDSLQILRRTFRPGNETVSRNFSCREVTQNSHHSSNRVRAEMTRDGSVSFEEITITNDEGQEEKRLQVQVSLNVRLDGRDTTEAGWCDGCEDKLREETIVVTETFPLAAQITVINPRILDALNNATETMRDQAFSDWRDILQSLEEERIQEIAAALEEELSKDCAIEISGSSFDLDRLVRQEFRRGRLKLTDSQMKVPPQAVLNRFGIKEVTDPIQKAECLESQGRSLTGQELEDHFFTESLPVLQEMLGSEDATQVAKATEMLRAMATRTQNLARRGGPTRSHAQVYVAAAASLRYHQLSPRIEAAKDNPTLRAALEREAEVAFGETGRNAFGVTTANLPRAHSHLSGLHDDFRIALGVHPGSFDNLANRINAGETNRQVRGGSSTLGDEVIRSIMNQRPSIPSVGLHDGLPGRRIFDSLANGQSINQPLSFTRTRTAGSEALGTTGLGNTLNADLSLPGNQIGSRSSGSVLDTRGGPTRGRGI